MDRRQKLGAVVSKHTPGLCPACPVLLPWDCQLWWGREAKRIAGKSILATHSAAEIHWAYLHWLFRVKQGQTFGEGEQKESLF